MNTINDIIQEFKTILSSHQGHTYKSLRSNLYYGIGADERGNKIAYITYNDVLTLHMFYKEDPQGQINLLYRSMDLIRYGQWYDVEPHEVEKELLIILYDLLTYNAS